MKRDPNTYPTETRIVHTGCGPMYVRVLFNDSEDKIVRVLIQAGKAGGCASLHLRGLAQALTYLQGKPSNERALEYEQLHGSNCHSKPCCIHEVVKYIKNLDYMLIDAKRAHYEDEEDD